MQAFTSEGSYKADDLLNVYLFGSRLYGVAAPAADYDLICVIEGEYFHGSRQIEYVGHLQPAGKMEVTLNLYHIQFFRDLVPHPYLLPNLRSEYVQWIECSVLPTHVRTARTQHDQQPHVLVHAP